MGVQRDFSVRSLAILRHPPAAGRLPPRGFKRKAPAVRSRKMGKTCCRPPAPRKHPHACRITRTLNEVITTIGPQLVSKLRPTWESAGNRNRRVPAGALFISAPVRPNCNDGSMSNRIAFLGCGSMNEAILAGLLGAAPTPPTSWPLSGGRNALRNWPSATTALRPSPVTRSRTTTSRRPRDPAS